MKLYMQDILFPHCLQLSSILVRSMDHSVGQQNTHTQLISYRLHQNINSNQGRRVAHNFNILSHFKYDQNQEIHLYRCYTCPLNDN